MRRDATSWRDEIALREASLADARREAAAGELSPEALAALEERENAALAAARTELAAAEALAAAPGAPRPRRASRRRRRGLLLVAALSFAAALVVVLVASLSPRQPGDSPTGSISLDTRQRVARLLAEAEADVANSDETAALAAYREVLALEPRNVTALTQTGWLDFSAGSAAQSVALTDAGIEDLRAAITYAPRDPAPRLYYAIAAASTPGNAPLAKAQLRIFLTLSPSAAQRALAAPYLLRFHLTG
jgi:hypothetical protein